MINAYFEISVIEANAKLVVYPENIAVDVGSSATLRCAVDAGIIRWWLRANGSSRTDFVQWNECGDTF